MSTNPVPKLTLELFFAESDRLGGKRNEYYDGQLIHMGAATPNRTTIAANLVGVLGNKTQGTSCRTLASSAEIYIPRTDLGTPGIYMPDVSVVCGKRQYHPIEQRAFVNPISIFEVRSPSTERRDYSAKFLGYRSIESLREYILLSQHDILVEHWKLDNLRCIWYLKEHRIASEALGLEFGAEVSIEDIYRDVEFD
jgi:Uma2 family endonuclease